MSTASINIRRETKRKKERGQKICPMSNERKRIVKSTGFGLGVCPRAGLLRYLSGFFKKGDKGKHNSSRAGSQGTI